MQNVSDIAARIRELREVCGYTQEALANELGIELSLYRSYEQDGHDIPISVIFEIANLFHVDFTEIVTGIGAKLDTYHVVRAGEGRPVDRLPGYHFTDLAFRYSHKVMQPLIVTLEPSDTMPELVTHKGQEFNFVLDGSVSIVFGDREITLSAGDSIYFNPKIPHGQKCAGDTTARFLTVIAE